MHRGATMKWIAAIAEARRDHAHVGGHDLGNAAQAAFQRIHASEAERESFEPWIQRPVAPGRQLLERTALCIACRGQDAAWVEAELPQCLFRTRRSAVGKARQALGESKLAGFEPRQAGR